MDNMSLPVETPVVYAQVECSQAVEQLWGIFFDDLEGGQDPSRAASDAYLTGARRTRLLESNMIKASQGASVDTDVWCRLSLIDHDELALGAAVVFQFEAVCEAGLSNQKRARLTLKDHVFDSPLDHHAPNEARCIWQVPVNAVVDRRKRIVIRPFTIELLSDLDD